MDRYDARTGRWNFENGDEDAGMFFKVLLGFVAFIVMLIGFIGPLLYFAFR